MEDLFGILIMIAVGLISVFGRVAKAKQGKTQSQWPQTGQWPQSRQPQSGQPQSSPQPSIPRPQTTNSQRPVQNWPQPPGWVGAPKPAAKQQPATLVDPQPQQRLARESLSDFPVWGEGVGTEGSRISTEGPSGVHSLAEEVQRFERQANQLRSHHLEISADDPFKQTEFEELHGDLTETPDAYDQVETVRRVMDLSGLLSSPSAAAQGIVLAEVLGKPKALRREKSYR